MAVGGTKPRPEMDEAESSAWVRDMFGRVAPRYDLLNRILSLQIDRIWRWRTARILKPELHTSSKVLDLCCGTGDLLAALESVAPAHYLGADFCFPMLVRTREKSAAPLLEADGLRLPLQSSSIDVITIGFGFRNFVSYADGLNEMLRVLRPGGLLAILEFTQPPAAIVRLFMSGWNRFVMNPVGRMISGEGDAYQYLPESVSRFPAAPLLAEMMTQSGYRSVSFRYFDLGIVALHLGRKATESKG